MSAVGLTVRFIAHGVQEFRSVVEAARERVAEMQVEQVAEIEAAPKETP